MNYMSACIYFITLRKRHKYIFQRYMNLEHEYTFSLGLLFITILILILSEGNNYKTLILYENPFLRLFSRMTSYGVS